MTAHHPVRYAEKEKSNDKTTWTGIHAPGSTRGSRHHFHRAVGRTACCGAGNNQCHRAAHAPSSRLGGKKRSGGTACERILANDRDIARKGSSGSDGLQLAGRNHQHAKSGIPARRYRCFRRSRRIAIAGAHDRISGEPTDEQRKMRSTIKRISGFTLIELLTALLILSLL